MNNEYVMFCGELRHNMLTHYTEKITHCLSDISSLFSLYEAYDIDTLPPCATNYRDALFHFIRLYKADEVSEAVTQASNIDEHLDRLIKDTYVNFLQISLKRIEEAYLCTADTEGKKCLQKSMHTLKDLVLMIRSNSLQIYRLFQSDENVDLITSKIKSVTADMNNLGLISVLIPSKA